MTACSAHSPEPAEQERITRRRTGSGSPGRTLLCRPIKKGPETLCVNSLNHKPQLALPLKHLHAAPCKAGARYFGIQIAAFRGPPTPFGLSPCLITDLQTLSLGSSRNRGTFASGFGTLLFYRHPVLLTQGAAYPPLLDYTDTKSGVICRESHVRNAKRATLAFETEREFRMHLAFQF